jgi:hypothetical protein
VLPEGLGKLKNFIHLIGSRTQNLPASIKIKQEEIKNCRRIDREEDGGKEGWKKK